jgi:hypothetical protein
MPLLQQYVNNNTPIAQRLLLARATTSSHQHKTAESLGAMGGARRWSGYSCGCKPSINRCVL